MNVRHIIYTIVFSIGTIVLIALQVMFLWNVWERSSATHVHPVQVIERTVHTSSNYTITTNPDTTAADPDLDDQLNAECAWALQRHTDDPMQGLLIHIERRWAGDSCAALEHYHQHGWY